MTNQEETELSTQMTPTENGTVAASKKKRTWKLGKKKRRQVIQTIILYCGFFALGIMFSIVGPTLLDLGRITNSDTKSVSYVFTSRSVGGLLGAIVAGVIIHKVNHWLLLGVIMIAMGSVMASVPHILVLPLLCAVMAASGVFGAMYDAGGNMVLLRVWGKENGPWMQALHCIFGLGALIGPLVAEPFLQARLPADSLQTAGAALSTVAPPVGNSSSIVYQDPSGALKEASSSSSPFERAFYPPANVTIADDGKELLVVAFNNTKNDNSSAVMTASPYQSKIHGAYLLVGLLSITSGVMLMSIAFFCSEIKLACRTELRDDLDEKENESENDHRSKALRITLICFLFVFYLTYCILEMNVGNYLTAYAVKGLGWTEKEGARVTSGYWGTFTGGRALGILIVNYVRPSRIIVFDLTVTVLSMGTLLFLAQAHMAVLWVCTLVLGFGISTVFATGITWAEIYINISKGVGAVFMVAAAGGEMVGPVVIGALFDSLGPQAFLYVMFAAACLLVVLFTIMLLLARKLGKRPETREAGGGDGETKEERTQLQGQEDNKIDEGHSSV